MKKKGLFAGISLIAALPLSSCSLVSSSSIEESSGTNSSGGSDISSSLSSDGPIVPDGVYLADTQETVAEYDERGVFWIDGACPSVGSPKMLVIPVVFKDIASTYAFSESEMAMLNEAYTSTTLQDTALYSLTEYYRISSYGNLNIDVTIHDPMTTSLTQSQFESASNGTASLMIDLMDQMVDLGEDLGDYDSNGDGYVDGIHFIYKTTRTLYDRGGLDCWWHYTSYFDMSAPSGMTAKPRTYFFSCFNDESGMDNGYYGSGVPDTHTIIHETGHMLGQTDFYDGDGNEAPSGFADMMDFNVGDHCAYTKMLLGWADPLVLDGTVNEFEVTLRPFETSGDFILLKDTTTDPWNGTPYDEYLTLSYYTPTVLNERDSNGYEDWNGHGTYSVGGLQVFHVDARAEAYVNGRYSYYDPAINDPSDFVGILADNMEYYSYRIVNGREYNNSPYRLIEAITSDGVDRFGDFNIAYSYYFGNNRNLFGLGSTYGGYEYTNETMAPYFTNGTSFNDGSSLDYSFRVVSMDSEGLTISFTR